MKEQFLEKRFQKHTMKMIDQANVIINEYIAMGFRLTIRQLYYQFVSRDMIENTIKSYKIMVNVINDGRLAGLIDWDAIEDRTRFLRKQPSWDSGASIIDSCADQYKVDRWENQEYRPEVWIEKDALIGVIEGICNQYDVPFFACRGYASQSELWRAGHRYRRYIEEGQMPYIIYIGDHDPSGIDMTRDNAFRMEMFAGQPIQVNRIALNHDQVKQYNPPPNPAKTTDSRSGSYINEHGYLSWELDALDPRTIADMISDTITSLLDQYAWDEQIKKENIVKKELVKVRDDFEARGI